MDDRNAARATSPDDPGAWHKRYRALLDSTLDGIILTDLAFVIQEWNRGAEQLYGWTAKEAIGKRMGELVPTRYTGQGSDEAKSALLSQGFWRGDATQTARDGQRVQVHASVGLVRDETGAPVGVLAINRDLSELRGAEEELRGSETLFRSTFEYSAIGMALVSTDWSLLSANPALSQILGYSEEELIEIGVAGFSLPEDREFSGQAFRELAAGEREHYTLEKRVLHKSGATVWGQLTCSLIRDPEGHPQYVLAQLLDLTDRKAAELERAQLEEQLRQSQKMEAVGRLAGGIAHDFNNLLTVIQSYATLIEEELEEQDPIKDDIKEIREAGERATDLTRQLLAFSRQQPLEPRVLEPNAVLEGLEKILGRLIGEHIRFSMKLHPGAGRINADPSQLEQLLMNLVINARDAMPDGGELVIETAEAVADAAFVRRHPGTTVGPQIRISVTDTGLGMSHEVLEHIFEPFFTTKEKGRGTGLGLSTAYGIVRQSGGALEVESECDRGTCFRIYLPRVDASAAPAGGAASIGGLRGSETILVVEDERPVRDLCQRIFSRSGYEVFLASCGEEALQRFEQRSGEIELVVTDVVMPGMTGPDLASALQRLRPGLKILFMSGYLDDELGQHGVLDASTNFIAKPFSGPALLAKVRAVLDRKE